MHVEETVVTDTIFKLVLYLIYIYKQIHCLAQL